MKKINFILAAIISFAAIQARAAIVHNNAPANSYIKMTVGGGLGINIPVNNVDVVSVVFQGLQGGGAGGVEASTGGFSTLVNAAGNNVLVLSSGTSVAPSGNFNNVNTNPFPVVVSASVNTGLAGQGYRYIGVKLPDPAAAGMFKYAWIRFEIRQDTFVVKDYAYQTTHGTAIMAGDTGGGAPVVVVDSVDVKTQGGAAAFINGPGKTLQMTAAVFPANGSQAVNWSIVRGTGNAVISSAGLITASANGTIYAKAVSSADNRKADSLLITISSSSVGINEVSDDRFSIYPNPASGWVYIAAKGINTELSIRVMDIQGRCVKSVTAKAGTFGETLALDIRDIPHGIYFLNIAGENISSIRKIELNR